MADMETVVNAIPEKEVNEDRFKFTASNGVVFELRPVPPLLVSDARTGIPVPTPPRYMNEDKGVEEENPDHPSHQRALEEYREAISEVTNAVYLTRGTRVTHIPDGFPKVDDLEWEEDITEFTNLKIPKVGRRRYYCWLKWVALEKIEDFTGLLNAAAAAGGRVMEEAVAQATEEFRRAAERGADNDGASEEAGGLGDNVHPASAGSSN